MTARPRKPCTYPGCTALTDGRSSRCPKHPREQWAGNATSKGKRTTGRALQRARAELFARAPLCAHCEAEGRVAAAVIRDHIVPLAEGGEDVESNTQGLCQACSDRKSEEERKRGIGRSYRARRGD